MFLKAIPLQAWTGP